MQRFLIICLALLGVTMGFVPSPAFPTTQLSTSKIAIHSLPQISTFDSFADSTSTISDATTTNILAVSTLDPTTFLSDVLGGLLGSYAILAVPIVAALAVAGIIAFAIVSYANPADEDD